MNASKKAIDPLACRVALGVLLFAGCQQEMAVQPYYRPLEPSKLFADGRSARPIPPGAISRDAVHEGALLYTGKSETIGWKEAADFNDQTLGGKPLVDYSTRFPFRVTEEDFNRGRQRYQIYCSVCHGATGDGDGPIVMRGFTAPPSYHRDESRALARRGMHVSLREVPAGYLFEVISKGFGAMPDYASQIPAEDRWKIAAYVRALQLSQGTDLNTLPNAARREADNALEKAP